MLWTSLLTYLFKLEVMRLTRPQPTKLLIVNDVVVVVIVVPLLIRNLKHPKLTSLSVCLRRKGTEVQDSALE